MTQVTMTSWDPEIRSLLERQTENGGPFWSRADGDIHAPAGFSTIDVVGVLGELGAGVDHVPEVAGAAEFLFSYQTNDGAFRYSKKSSKYPCFAGRIAAALCRVGVGQDDVRLRASYDWMLDHLWHDGGWRCATVKLGISPETDASNPGATLYVLDALRFRPRCGGALDGAIQSLLHHWETRLPMGPCTFGMGSRFGRVEYPFLRYNLFYYVYVLSHFAGARRDPRFRLALAELASHLRGGEMPVETPHRAWRGFRFAAMGEPSALATERWREIQANMAS